MRDAEFDLLVNACAASLNIRPIELPCSVDWDRLLALAGRHRVQALCWDGLKPFAETMPQEIASELQAQARAIVVTNLRIAAECERLRQAFETAVISLLFVKGLTLGALAYREPYLKMSVDIDLLVEPDRLADAAQELGAIGYACMTPGGAGAGKLKQWHRNHKESVWHRSEGAFQIDLHTRLADQSCLLSGITAASPSRLVEVATGIKLPTLTDDDLFAYLCIHGASSAWFRLKWITDLCGLLRAKDETEIERLYDHASRLGAGRAAGQALLLADLLYGIGLGHDLRNRLNADPAIRWLIRVAEGQLHHPVEPTERFLGTGTIHLSQLGLAPGWGFKATEVARQLRDMMAVA